MTTSAGSSPPFLTTSVALTTATHARLLEHLDRPDGQEDLSFALWRPSTGATRRTAIVHELVLPRDGERHVHGNASFESSYFLRAATEAARADAGLALVHSHPTGRGWQATSRDDEHTEREHAAQAKALTGHPLLGMTTATGDRAWSARLWNSRSGRIDRIDARTVRIVGDRMLISLNPHMTAARVSDARLTRTVSAWGPDVQQALGHLRVGVVGAGSVGALVAETLSRIGVRDIVLIDFDAVEEHNLDRLLHADRRSVRLAQTKVENLLRPLRRAATHPAANIIGIEASVIEPDGTAAALDCDILFSCVDRPWPRAHLNAIAYAHLIPVIDGGIRITRTRTGRMAHADWRAHIAAPGRACLACLRQYDPADAAAERQGTLDDPRYINALPRDHPLRGRQNVFAFATGCADLEIGQFVSMLAAPSGIANRGPQLYHLTTGTFEPNLPTECEHGCPYSTELLATADKAPVGSPAAHPAAEAARASLGRRRSTRTVRTRRAAARLLDFAGASLLDRP